MLLVIVLLNPQSRTTYKLRFGVGVGICFAHSHIDTSLTQGTLFIGFGIAIGVAISNRLCEFRTALGMLFPAAPRAFCLCFISSYFPVRCEVHFALLLTILGQKQL